jgi:hypothetical protein
LRALLNPKIDRSAYGRSPILRRLHARPDGNGAKAREFIEDNQGGTVYKTPCVPYIWGERPDRMIFASVISPGDTGALSAICYTPCLLQEYAPKEFELRVAVINGRIFMADCLAPFTTEGD